MCHTLYWKFFIYRIFANLPNVSKCCDPCLTDKETGAWRVSRYIHVFRGGK